MPTREEIQDEDRRARRARMIVDFTANVIMQSGMRRSEAEALVQAARAAVLELFPGREQTYELLYAGRFRRLLDEFTRPDPPDSGAGGGVVPFPGLPRT